MDILKQFSIIKAAYEEFKILIGQHPIAAIAMTILFPVGVAATCVWGVRKVIILNQESSKPKIEIKPLETKVAETTAQTAGVWNKRNIALGALAVLGLGAAIYYYSQTPEEIVKIVKSIPFPSPFQSSINSTFCSIFDNIQNVQKPITEVVGSLPKSLPFTAMDLNPICHLNESIAAPAVNVVRTLADALPSVVIPVMATAPVALPNVTAPATSLIKWIPNPFQSSTSFNTSSLYNLVVYNATAAIEKISVTTQNMTVPAIKAPAWIPNPFQSSASLNTSSICDLVVDNATALIKNVSSSIPAVVAPLVKNPIIETAKNVVKSGAFSFADKIRLAATEGVLMGVLYDKFYPLKRRHQQVQDAAKEVKAPSSAWTYLPSLGIVGGTFVGTIANLWHNQSLFDKTSMLCTPMKQSSVLSKINMVQQGVTKALGLGFNLIPGLIVLAPAAGVAAYKYFRSDNEVEKKESKVLVGRISVDVVKTTLMSLIAIVGKQVIKLNQNSFDPSGHIMLKAAGLHGLMASQKYISDPLTRTVSSLFVVYSVVTDSLFLANTAGCFHTPLDIVAGSVYALGIFTLTNRLVDSAVDYYYERQDSIAKLFMDRFDFDNHRDGIESKLKEKGISAFDSARILKDISDKVREFQLERGKLNEVVEI